ncbi:conserved exported hypothetical protein [Gammaproteobacteria bacterium]
MKLTIATCVILGSLAVGGLARADSDDIKWIAQCMLDNKDEGAATGVVEKYCKCMNNKMDANESRSVSQWELTHETEAKECSRKAGWK